MWYLLFPLIIISLKIMAASVLIIESYHQEYDWDRNYNKGMIQSLVMDTIIIILIWLPSGFQRLSFLFKLSEPDTL